MLTMRASALLSLISSASAAAPTTGVSKKFSTASASSSARRPGVSRGGGLRGGESSSDASTSIVGGDKAPAGAYPWMVAVLYGKSDEDSNFNAYDIQGCGGTLIDPEWVLTAAHCVEEGAPDSVLVGAYDLLDWRTEDYGFQVEHRQVLEAVSHEEYDDKMLRHDVALLRIEPSTLPTLAVAAATPSVGDDVTAIGWGDTTKSDKRTSYPTTLRDVTIDVIDCEDAIDDDHKSYLCASPPKSGEDACQGDSGGPLVAHLGGDAYELVGATSWGIGCNGGGVYADVADYHVFIQEHTGAQPPDSPSDDGQDGGGDGGASCVDDDDFSFRGNSNKDCAWVARNAAARCSKKDGGVPVNERCKVTCGTCDDENDDDAQDDAGDECKDDPDWYFKKTSRDCDWVAKKTSRCKKSHGGVSARQACALACGTCDK